MRLSEAMDRLYAADPDEFVPLRKQCVAQARADGDRPLAGDIQALRRPTRSAWMVNLLAREHGEELSELLELGPALSQAHTGGSMAELRQISALRRRALDGLIRLARDTAREAGHQPTQATLTEVHTILDAALTHPEVGEAVTAGVLTRAPESAAAFPTELFAPLAEVVELPVRRRAAAGSEETDADAEQDQADQERAEHERAEQERATARRELTEAEAQQAEAEGASDDAHRVAEQAAKAVADLERRLGEARTAADAAERDARAAAERRDTRVEATESARQRLADLDG